MIHAAAQALVRHLRVRHHTDRLYASQPLSHSTSDAVAHGARKRGARELGVLQVDARRVVVAVLRGLLHARTVGGEDLSYREHVRAALLHTGSLVLRITRGGRNDVSHGSLVARQRNGDELVVGSDETRDAATIAYVDAHDIVL